LFLDLACSIVEALGIPTTRQSEEELNAWRTISTLCFCLVAEFVAAQSSTSTTAQPESSSAGSPAAAIGMFVNPKNAQTHEQQAADEKTCYATAQ
jgi:hypothetical protein